MNILHILICSLFSCLSCQGQAFQIEQQYVRSKPQSGLVVSIDPHLLCRNGLIQSWQKIDGPLRNRRIKSTAFSKVDFKLKPLSSLNGAMLTLSMEGTSVGESIASGSTVSKNTREIVVDSLTKFKSNQILLVNHGGIEFGVPTIQVKSSQSFNRVNSKNPFTTMFAKSALKNTSDRIQSDADDFSRRQICSRLATSFSRVNANALATVNRLQQELPLIRQFAWSFSSDSRNLYLTAEANSFATDPVPENESAISVAIHESTASELLNQRIASRKFDSRTLQESYSRVSKDLQLPKLNRHDEANWAISFSAQAAKVAFKGNQIFVELASDEISSGDRSITGVAVQFSYHLCGHQNKWLLKRAKEVNVYDPNSNGGRQGARQTAFRTVMRKRFAGMLPDSVALPSLLPKSQLVESGLELVVEQVFTENRNLVIAINSR